MKRPLNFFPKFPPLKVLLLPTILAAILILASCVPNRKIAYLQYEDELTQSSGILTDSIVRRYENVELRYRLQPNDVLNIKIATETPEEYNPFAIADKFISSGGVSAGNIGQNSASNIGYRVDPFGYLKLPVIGDLFVEGFTIDELENLLDSLASAQLENPVSKIALMNFRFSVLGEVSGEGLLVSNDNSLTMMQAIAMSGGPDEYGDISRVKVIRHIGDENLIFYVNLLDESYLSSNFFYVYPNDVIIVPPLDSRVYFKYVSPNLSFIASTISLLASVITLFAIFGGSGN